MPIHRGVVTGAVAVLLAVGACAKADGGPATADLTGAGATFPFPLYRRWFAAYGDRTGTRINYLSVGSDAGLRLLDSAAVDFAAVERDLHPDDLDRAGCRRIAVPTVGGAIAVVYNLPTLQNALRFDADLLADIFAGRVRRWDDPAVATRNPGVELPATPIHVVHRVSGSGTSRAFATFLASSRRGWPGGEEAWRTGEAAEGNEGVAAAVQQATGAIGYVELSYATLGRLQVGLVRNARGEDVLPSDASVRGAMEAFDPATLKAALVLSPTPRAYPVAAVTWLVVDPATIAPDQVARVLGFITWALHDGASAAAALEYVPLPPRVVAHYDSVLTEARLNPCQPAGRPTRP